MLDTLSQSVLSIIYPQDCTACGGLVESHSDGVACSDCWTETRIFNGSETLCTKCGAFLFHSGSSASTALCRKCDDLHFDRALAVGIYEHALSASIIRLKRSPYIAKRVRRLLDEALMRVPTDESTLIIPIPLSRKRRQERGFNQAEVVARSLARVSGLRIDGNSLVRKVHTPMHRAGMDKKARAMTVKNAFEVVRPKLIKGRSILLIDDVFTSGETASMCAKVLKKNGAATVNVLTIARAA